MEAVLNLIAQRTADTTIMFDMLDHRDITGVAEVTVYKAMAYDEAEEAGKVERRAWRRHVPAKD